MTSVEHSHTVVSPPSSGVVVVPVERMRERKHFLHYPWKQYRGDKNWVPPLRQNQQELAGFRHHPFYDAAQAQTFVAYRQGEPVGRIAAIVNHAHNRKFAEKRGFFGFFESIHDEQVSSALLNAAWQWLQARGMTCLRGPTNPSINYEWGCLVEGFDSPPTFMMTYNPPYYAELFEAWGLKKIRDIYAYGAKRGMLGGLDQKLKFIVEESTRRLGATFRPADKKHFGEELRQFMRLYNESMATHWGFVPLSDAEIEHMGAAMKQLIVPDLTCVAEIDGKIAGCVFALLDYNPRIKAIDGRLFPFGWARLLGNKRRLKHFRILAANVMPEYQRWGLGLLLLSKLVPHGLEWGMNTVEFSWIIEDNTLSLTPMKRYGAILQKTWRIFDYDPASPTE